MVSPPSIRIDRPDQGWIDYDASWTRPIDGRRPATGGRECLRLSALGCRRSPLRVRPRCGRAGGGRPGSPNRSLPRAEFVPLDPRPLYGVNRVFGAHGGLSALRATKESSGLRARGISVSRPRAGGNRLPTQDAITPRAAQVPRPPRPRTGARENPRSWDRAGRSRAHKRRITTQPRPALVDAGVARSDLVRPNPGELQPVLGERPFGPESCPGPRSGSRECRDPGAGSPRAVATRFARCDGDPSGLARPPTISRDDPTPHPTGAEGYFTGGPTRPKTALPRPLIRGPLAPPPLQRPPSGSPAARSIEIRPIPRSPPLPGTRRAAGRSTRGSRGAGRRRPPCAGPRSSTARPVPCRRG
jgi:hypothetical protein